MRILLQSHMMISDRISTILLLHPSSHPTGLIGGEHGRTRGSFLSTSTVKSFPSSVSAALNVINCDVTVSRRKTTSASQNPYADVTHIPMRGLPNPADATEAPDAPDAADTPDAADAANTVDATDATDAADVADAADAEALPCLMGNG